MYTLQVILRAPSLTSLSNVWPLGASYSEWGALSTCSFDFYHNICLPPCSRQQRVSSSARWWAAHKRFPKATLTRREGAPISITKGWFTHQILVDRPLEEPWQQDRDSVLGCSVVVMVVVVVTSYHVLVTSHVMTSCLGDVTWSWRQGSTRRQRILGWHRRSPWTRSGPGSWWTVYRLGSTWAPRSWILDRSYWRPSCFSTNFKTIIH